LYLVINTCPLGYKNSQLMLYREKYILFSEIHTKHTNQLLRFMRLRNRVSYGRPDCPWSPVKHNSRSKSSRTYMHYFLSYLTCMHFFQVVRSRTFIVIRIISNLVLHSVKWSLLLGINNVLCQEVAKCPHIMHIGYSIILHFPLKSQSLK
jgi:hypothetical protein